MHVDKVLQCRYSNSNRGQKIIFLIKYWQTEHDILVEVRKLCGFQLQVIKRIYLFTNSLSLACHCRWTCADWLLCTMENKYQKLPVQKGNDTIWCVHKIMSKSAHDTWRTSIPKKAATSQWQEIAIYHHVVPMSRN